MYEVIPFKSFMVGNIYPTMPVHSWLDGGLTFFISTGGVLLALVVLEKLGVEINESLVRLVVLSAGALSFLWAIFKNPLFRSLVIGF
ncbi:hypothetical protein [Niallia sp. FSL K6-0077]|uniref:hypothetical protein n=1 Tax=Niallia sp. FSL K6-0077 TaxID=2954743 RepID=UPI0030F9053E